MCVCVSESIEYIEGLADSAPRTPLSPLSPQQFVSLSQSACVSPVQLTEGTGGGVGRGAESYDLNEA